MNTIHPLNSIAGNTMVINQNNISRVSVSNRRFVTYPVTLQPISGMPSPYKGEMQSGTSGAAITERQQIPGQNVFEIDNVQMTSDNDIRHDFFFKLKAAIAKRLEEDCNGVIFNKDSITNNEVEWSAMDCLRCMTCKDPDQDEVKRLKEQKHHDVQLFAARMTTGLVYQFQDQIPLLIPESRDELIKTITQLVFEYTASHSVFFDAQRVTIFDILMSSNNHFVNTIFPSMSVQLKTYKGYEVPLTSLFLLGTRTVYGGKYEPQRSRAKDALNEMKSLNFPPYRWGTSQVEFYPMRNSKYYGSIKLTPVEQELGGTSTEDVFWSEAEKFIQQFLL